AQKHKCRDARQTLPGTRASRCFSQTETRKRFCRRDAEVVFDTVCVRDLLESMDSSALATLSAFGSEGGRCSGVLEVPSIGTRKQGENSHLHERAVFASASLGW